MDSTRQTPGTTTSTSSTGDDFDAWVQPYLGLLRALEIREVGTGEADDLVQDTLLRAWRKRSTYRGKRGTPKVWLIAVLLDQARRRRVRRRPAPATDALPSVLRDNAAMIDLDTAVRALPRRQREAVTLYYLADLSVAEVAEALGITAGSVKTHLHAARAALRARLEES